MYNEQSLPDLPVLFHLGGRVGKETNISKEDLLEFIVPRAGL